jgi:hypothetical protein
MSQLLTALFGKSSGITKLDVEEKILNIQKESSTLEFKELKLTKMYDENKEQCIIKPIIGFINKLTNGDGLLILGIDEEDRLAKSIKPISKSLIKDEEQLRAILASNILSIPHSKEFPELMIQKVSMGTDNIFLVEVKRTNDNCVYYSAITDNAYVRINDVTERLSLPGTIDLIARKNFPQIFMYINESEESGDEFVYDVGLINEGLEPGRYVTAIIGFYHEHYDLNVVLEGTDIFDIDKTTRNIHKTGAKKAYQVMAGYPPKSLLLYPKRQMYIGRLKISPKKNFNLKLHIEICEERGITEQEIVMVNVGGARSREETTCKFTPYLTLR